MSAQLRGKTDRNVPVRKSARGGMAAARNDTQMDIIRHPARAQDAAFMLPRAFCEQCLINPVYVLGVEYSLAVAAPLGDVIECADRHHARIAALAEFLNRRRRCQLPPPNLSRAESFEAVPDFPATTGFPQLPGFVRTGTSSQP